jgi:hypothetical protein
MPVCHLLISKLDLLTNAGRRPSERKHASCRWCQEGCPASRLQKVQTTATISALPALHAHHAFSEGLCRMAAPLTLWLCNMQTCTTSEAEQTWLQAKWGCKWVLQCKHQAPCTWCHRP